MQTYKTAILATSIVALAGCASWDKSPICNPSHTWVAWSDVRCNADNASKATDDSAARLAALEKEHKRLADELAAAQRQNGALNSRVSDLEGQLTQSKGSSLANAEKDLLKALQPEISKGTVSVTQSGDALTINLASSLLFDSGQDQLKAGGTDALKRVGGVLTDFRTSRCMWRDTPTTWRSRARCRRSSHPTRSFLTLVPIVPLEHCGTAA